MTPERAAVLLVVDPRADAATVRTAYAAAVKRAHPDTAAEGTSGVPIRDLQAARDLLLCGVETQNSACKLCQGSGKVRGAMGLRDCAACNGTGDSYGQS